MSNPSAWQTFNGPIIHLPVVHGAMDCGQKKRSVSVAVLPAPVRVPSQRPLAPSVASVMSIVNDKGDNEKIREAEHRSGICLTAEENLGACQNISWGVYFYYAFYIFLVRKLTN